jgi:hypothetical protein
MAVLSPICAMVPAINAHQHKPGDTCARPLLQIYAPSYVHTCFFDEGNSRLIQKTCHMLIRNKRALLRSLIEAQLAP